jgi:hypothetical protein
MGKLLILCGAILIVVGLLMEYGTRIPYIGRLPGDIVVENKNFKFYFPIVTSIILSIAISLIIYLVNKFRS